MKPDHLFLELDIPGYNTLYMYKNFSIESNLGYYIFKARLESNK